MDQVSWIFNRNSRKTGVNSTFRVFYWWNSCNINATCSNENHVFQGCFLHFSTFPIESSEKDGIEFAIRYYLEWRGSDGRNLSFLIQNSSFLIQNSSFLMHNSPGWRTDGERPTAACPYNQREIYQSPACIYNLTCTGTDGYATYGATHPYHASSYTSSIPRPRSSIGITSLQSPSRSRTIYIAAIFSKNHSKCTCFGWTRDLKAPISC